MMTALALSLVGAMAAHASPMAQSYRVWVEKFKCIEETSEASASDETYIVAYIADRSRIGKSDFAASERAFLKGPIEDTDAGETKTLNLRLWHPLYSAGRPIPDADDILIACCLVEHDNERTSELAKTTEEKCVAALLHQKLSGNSRDGFMSAIKEAMGKAMDIDYGEAGEDIFANEDDRIGPAFGVRFFNSDLTKANPVRKSVTVWGDGGRYTVTLKLERSPG